MKEVINKIKTLLLVFFLMGSLQLRAQEKHFIYIQSENKQPFYTQVNNKVFSSTEGGYVIIPQLTSGKYLFQLGFAGDQVPEQKFIIDVANRDAGFTLKDFGEKGWGLIDIINFTTIMADNGAVIREKAVEAVNTDSSSNQIKDTVKVNTVATVNKVSTDSSAKETHLTKVPNVPIITPQTSTEKKPGTTLILARPSKLGIDRIYTVPNKDKTDTVAIFIPTSPEIKQVKKDIAREDTVAVKPAVVDASTVVSKKCNAVADDKDFLKTRLDMAACTTEEAMINVGVAAFKIKCYSVSQVKNLSVLFLSEQSKYRFFQSAKQAVSDIENYPSLETQLTMPSLIKQFRASL